MATTFELICAEVALMLILVGYLVKYYKNSHVSWDVICATYISWVLGFAGTVLLPFDIAITLAHGHRNEALDDLWDFIYWSTFALAWFILPIQMAYHLSGDFSFGGKLCEALKSNLYSYLACFAVGLIFIIYVMATKGTTGAVHFVGFMMAMGNTYGIVLIILLMGNGLVALPRRLWHMGNTKVELTRLYLQAIQVESAFHDARFELEDCEAEVARTIEAFDLAETDRTLRPFLDIVRERSETFVFALRSTSNKFRNVKEKKKLEPVTTRKQLVDLHARVKKAQLRVLAGERRWRSLLLKVKVEQSLLDGTLRPEDSGWCEMRTETSTRVRNNSNCFSGITYSLLSCYDRVRYFWRKYVFAIFCRCLAVLCALASGLIFYSELAMSTSSTSPVGSTISGLSMEGAGVFAVQSISFAYLFYMSLCTFWSLFKMNLGWSFTLQGPQESPDSSLLFNATYLSRLQFSLGYNFLLFLNVKKIENTSFQMLMESMNIVPLFGDSFSIYAPIITALVGLFTFFNLYSRLLKFVGIEDEDSAGSTDCCHRLNTAEQEEVEAGKKLVTGQLRSLNNKLFLQPKASSAPQDTAALLSASLSNEDLSGGESPSPVHLDDDDDEEGSSIMMTDMETGIASSSVRNALFLSSKATPKAVPKASAACSGGSLGQEKKSGGGSSESGWGDGWGGISAPVQTSTRSASAASSSGNRLVTGSSATASAAGGGWGAPAAPSSSGTAGGGWGAPTGESGGGRYGGRYS